MKIRMGFVSNSSSSSFLIQDKGLTEEQKKIISDLKNKIDEYEEKEINDYGDNMDIYIEGTTISIGAPYGSEGTIAMLLTILGIKFEIGD